MSDSPELRTDLNVGELDCLTVLWAEGGPLRVSEIHRKLLLRREQAGEAPPALTTISTYLRSLLDKGLLREVTLGGSGMAYASGTRGMIPTTRSPKTGYEVVHAPGAILKKTFRALAEAYPPDQRHQALIDFARALDLSEDRRASALVEFARTLGFPEEIIAKLKKLVPQD
jgi:hypothetical protein